MNNKPRRKDRVGEKFGRLTIIEFSHVNAKYVSFWKCKCDCGNEVVVDVSSLVTGNTVSCGCYGREKRREKTGPIKDIAGQRFGKLVVLSFSHSDKRGKSHWLCKCDCGNKKIISGDSLQQGHTRSCGCPEEKDYTGKRFERLLIIGKSNKTDNYGHLYWDYLCDCGNTGVVRGADLRAKTTVSCGCYNREILTKSVTSHGKSYETIYGLYQSMIERCNSKTSHAYPNYGGRGITVCGRWSGEGGFENFYEDMGERPEGCSLDRIDNAGPYSPENCRWATQKQQSRNMRTNHLITYKGITQCVTAWAEEIGVKPPLLFSRIRLGWSIEEMLTIPPGQKSHKKELKA